jgi:cell division protein FtsI (penicillin-binding protein 3)
MMDFFRHNREEIGGASSAMLAQAKFRLLLTAFFFLLGYFAITLRLVDLTLIRSSEDAAAIENSAKPAVAAADKNLRGSIIDRNGDLLATTLRMASVYADPSLIDNPKRVARDLADILPGQKADEIEKKLAPGKRFVWIERNITPKQEYAINALGHPGIAFQEEGRRIYPKDRLTSHLLGYTDVDGRGISGIEKAYNQTLAEGEEPVQLTIDQRIQHQLHRELSAAIAKFRAKAAIGMVMDVNTGEVIAMVSLPDFDPYRPMDFPADARFNRCTLGVFEMGSTMKLFSTAAALDSGNISFGTVFDAINPIKIGGHTISDYHPEKRNLTVAEIFMVSSNIGTGRMTQAIGTAALKSFYDKLGFFEPVPTTFPERGAPLYPKKWREVTTLTASFGHGISISPLHLMRAASALVNGGILVKPVFVKSERKTLSILKPQGDRVVSEKTATKIRQLLELTVVDGTGSKAQVDGYAIGGKTGTAEKAQKSGYNKKAILSSFIGFYPIDNPRYAILAMIDEPQPTKDTHGYATGGWTAAPVVARVIEQMAPLYQIAPHFDRTYDITREMAPYVKDKKKGSSVAAQGTNR